MARRKSGSNKSLAMELPVQQTGSMIEVGKSVRIDPNHRRGSEYLRSLGCDARTSLEVQRLDDNWRILVRNPNNNRSAEVTIGAISLG